jgi:hypothetical protein
MKSNIVKIFGGTVLAVLMISTLNTWVSAQGNSSGGGRLEGTWDVQVTPRNCQSGEAIRTFASTTTFMSGGTLLDSTSGRPQALKTPGHGVWNHIVGDIYRFSFKSFTFDSAGNFTGWQIVRHEASLDPRAAGFESAGTSEVYNANGNLISTGCSTASGTRFE